MDTFTIQYLIIGTLFIIAVYFLVRRTGRSVKGKGGCSKGCGCEKSEKPEKSKKAIY